MKPLAEDNQGRLLGRTAFSAGDLYRRPTQIVGEFEVICYVYNEVVLAGLTEAWLAIPASLNELRLLEVAAVLFEPDSDDVEIQIVNVTTGNDMLSTPITIDAGDRASYAATTPPVIDPAEAQVLTAHRLQFRVDEVDDALGLNTILVFG